MFKLNLEKAEEPEIKLLTYFGSQKKKQKNSRKTSNSVSLTRLKPMTEWNTPNCGKFLKKWEYQTTLPAFQKPVHSQEAIEQDMEQWTGSKL